MGEGSSSEGRRSGSEAQAEAVSCWEGQTFCNGQGEMGQGEEGGEEQVVIVGCGLGAGLFDEGFAPPCLLGARYQPLQDLFVGAGERQLL